MHPAQVRRNALLALVMCAIVGCGSSSPGNTDDASNGNDATTMVDSGTFSDAGSEDDGSVVENDVQPAGDVMVTPGDGVPPFDQATDARVRELVERGRARGNRHNVFAKIGDSITESASFLFDCGFGWFMLGEHTDLGGTIQYFSAEPLDMGRNSFNRASLSAVAGWTASMALEGHPDSPLAHELNATQPQWALIMYGTNDVERVDVETYRAHLLQIVDIVLERDVVPVLSTIPPRLDGEPFASRVPVFNDAVRSIAAERHIPLMDYWAALGNAANFGISDDGIHPNLFTDPSDQTNDACDLTQPALQFGYNVRNLVALQMLARLRAY